MKYILTIILILALSLSLAACGGKGESADGTTGTSEATSTSVDSAADSSGADTAIDTDDAEDAVFPITFAGLTLKYPTKWQDRVSISETEDKGLDFSADGTSLFTLYADGEHIILGTVKGDEYTVISVDFNDDITRENDEFAAMQEDINVILQHLIADYDFEPGVALEEEDNSTFDIETPVVTMKYPAKWQERVTIDVRDDGVYFSCDGTPLFDLIFSERDNGYLLGTYNGTPIYIVDYPIEDDELAVMQEDVNVILQHLMEDEAFTGHIS